MPNRGIGAQTHEGPITVSPHTGGTVVTIPHDGNSQNPGDYNSDNGAMLGYGVLGCSTMRDAEDD